MLLADVDNNAIWALIGAAITAVGGVIVNIIMARHKVQQDERSSINNEWKELASRQQEQIDSLQDRCDKLEIDKENCHKENAALQTRVAVLELQAGMKPYGRPKP